MNDTLHREGRMNGRGHERNRGFRDFFDPRQMRRTMVRKGVRTAILTVLLEQPMHGYQVITELEARSGGRWRPSAGSVYPTLQQLEDEGLVRSEDQDGRRVYTLTDSGRTEAQQSPLNQHPWFTRRAGGEVDLRRLALQLVGASMQVAKIGSPDAQRGAAEILGEARRKLYGILAEDDGDLISATPEPRGSIEAEDREEPLSERPSAG